MKEILPSSKLSLSLLLPSSLPFYLPLPFLNPFLLCFQSLSPSFLLTSGGGTRPKMKPFTLLPPLLTGGGVAPGEPQPLSSQSAGTPLLITGVLAPTSHC